MRTNSMTSKSLIFYCTMVLFGLACTSKSAQPPKGKIPKKDSPASTIVYVQPFSDLPAPELAYVIKELKKVYSNIQVVSATDLPKSAYYPPRSRYRADSIITWLHRKTKPGAVTIGLTSKDISTSKGKHKDWGVMGLGYRPGNACVASSYRLHKNRRNQELFMTAVHELGHTQGLPHCPNKTCFMRDAEGGGFTGLEKAFCPECKQVLVNRGWKL